MTKAFCPASLGLRLTYPSGVASMRRAAGTELFRSSGKYFGPLTQGRLADSPTAGLKDGTPLAFPISLATTGTGRAGGNRDGPLPSDAAQS